tara:strand:+ start:929 stop:3064 length:2136 start_codon:yes stop_codon:yes gene_type:complete
MNSDHNSQSVHYVPEGTGIKRYVVTCNDSSDWDEIHDYIINENEIDNIPNRKIECSDDCKTCDRMASYEMSDEEAYILSSHEKVTGVHLDPDYYDGTFKGKTEELRGFKTSRYGSNVTIGRDLQTSNFLVSNPGSTLENRTGASIYRHQQKIDQWNNTSESSIILDNPEYYGDGTDVDVIVCDEAGWYGHIEFIKTGSNEATYFRGENVLKSGFSSSATTGVCGVLDCVLDAPYYIDPDFFEADAANRLEKRWDGTTVPVESVARDWWNNESTTYRSAKYVSNNISGGTAVVGSDEDFGTVAVSSFYTRARMNGSNTQQHTATDAFHATPCMSQAYGKTQGWAFNSNKWHMSIIFNLGSLTTTSCFKITKIFHQLKPNRSSDNTKNPTVSSNSWGSFQDLTQGYYYFRTAGDGSGGVNYTSSSKPAFLDYLYGNANRFSVAKSQSYSEVVLGDALVDAGVIFLAASGNNNQKMVLEGHPDYNNYEDTSSNQTLAGALTGDLYGRTHMTNRIGFPSQIGIDNSSGVSVTRAFNIGALDDVKASNTQEQKAVYSNMGNGIDCYAIGRESFSATDDNTSGRYNRYNSTYRLNASYQIVTSGGVESDDSQDTKFGGTSSATPVTAGLFATKLQFNRNWTAKNLKAWLRDLVTDQTQSAFFSGTESTTATDSNWASYRNLQGGARKIIFDAPTFIDNYTFTGANLKLTGDITIINN